ncbi:MAG: glycoside hydrolase family 3 C-terminal domain-containing protein [Paludibacter sp.]|jgi:beta-glucosidase|nr:glycoside hydrolase family 3 C-terminal domain-containing protein [Paludibacter sp.]
MRIPFFFAFLLFATMMQAQQNATLPFRNQGQEVEHRISDLISRMTVDEKINQLKYNAPAIERLGIPAYNWWNEGLHGVARFGRATVFPQPIAMAATFDADLIKRIGEAVSLEARAKHDEAVKIGNITQYGGLTLWSPNINIFRDPRWGRGMETFGEDPFLTSSLGVAYVKGLQGDHPYYYRTAACAKHIAVHSGPESERHTFDAYASPKDLYETYLPAFEALARAGVASVMCGYNRLYGEPCCASNLLLNELLRGKWQFKGQIVSDCWAVSDFHAGHKVTENVLQSAALALNSGVDVNCGDEFPALKEALKQGLVTEAEIDRALRNNLRVLFRLGMFDENHPYRNIPASVVGSPAHKALAREAAQKSIVLLKNNQVLPLSKSIKHLYMLGPNAADVDVLLGNYNGQTDEARTFLEGITRSVSLGTRLEYRRGFMYDQMNKNDINWAMTEAAEADAVIAVVGLTTLSEGEEGESIASDYKSDRRNLGIPETQMHYLRDLRSKVKKPLIIVVTGGSPVDLKEISAMADALLFVFYPGQAGGDALADIIFGDVSPSGKLPITFPASETHLPAYADYSMQGRTYKYMQHEPQYPFGFGLSYAKIVTSDPLPVNSIVTARDTLNIRIPVSNESDFAAGEVLQCYVKTPDAPFATPLHDLKAVKRIQLAAGQTETFNMQIPVSSLMSVNKAGEKVMLKGFYKLMIGTSLPTQRSKELGAALWKELVIKVR